MIGTFGTIYYRLREGVWPKLSGAGESFLYPSLTKPNTLEKHMAPQLPENNRFFFCFFCFFFPALSLNTPSPRPHCEGLSIDQSPIIAILGYQSDGKLLITYRTPVA